MAEDTITIKSLYERIIVLETKLDMMAEGDLGGRNYFKRAVYLILAIEIIGIFIDYFIS